MATVASSYYPAEILHEAGGLTASIYRHQDHLGHYFTVEFDHYFRYAGKLHRTRLFRDEHLLPLVNLARRTYNCIWNCRKLAISC